MKRFLALYISVFVFGVSINAQIDNRIKYVHQNIFLGTNSSIIHFNSDFGETYQSTKYFDSPIINPEPFLAVAFKLYGENLSIENISVSIKSNVSNEWLSFEYDDDVENINGELSSGLVFLDSKTE
ncbi:MAG: hypothetical protein Q8M94_09555, partial [Ignavibacteria bacterium]|nr:hypothetical protein [Ignavibacteria bacterium]